MCARGYIVVAREGRTSLGHGQKLLRLLRDIHPVPAGPDEAPHEHLLRGRRGAVMEKAYNRKHIANRCFSPVVVTTPGHQRGQIVEGVDDQAAVVAALVRGAVMEWLPSVRAEESAGS